MFTKVNFKGYIEGAAAYYQQDEALHVLQLQLYYNKLLNNKRYQVVTFKFVKRQELERCIKEFKASLGFEHLSELKSQEANFSFCMGRDETLISDAELNSISVGNRSWFPAGIGISDELMDTQTIFSCE